MVSKRIRNLTSKGKREQNSVEPDPQTSADEVALKVESLTVVPEIVEELTEQELEDRQRLELKVERAFVEAGAALRDLRDQRLYRSTHHTFEEYCRDRFGFNRISAHNKIAASDVFHNLFTIGEQIPLPTNERQVRPLTALKPEEQREVWQQSVEAAGGRVPSGRIVKDIVDRLKEKPLPQIPLSYKRNDAFILQGLLGTERRYNGCWAITREILEFSLIVETHHGSLQVKPDNLEPIDDRVVRRQLAALLKRLQRLRKFELDRGAIGVLELLGKQTYLT
ncbi:MAG: hypothetical protein JO235_28905, partial [Chroococcidiopsidaceae cyanobacterium CP_BM_RX_35]|nr:hypothetical protein [Chroococcidiopsidaceae cyanobacterium CP_BM_RX_35]